MPTIFESDSKPQTSISKDVKSASARSTRTNPLTCFAINPSGIRFETQQANEKVILFLRQHLIVNVPWVLLSFVLLVSPSIVFPLVVRGLQSWFSLPPSYIVVGTVFWYVATFGFVLANFLRWFFNIYIVTDQRIVDIDFINLLFKRFSEAELTKIQDISFTTGGIVATIFNYGNVLIETAGEMPNIEFESIPNPKKVVETIREVSEGAPNSL